jgi:hypothetical protein
MREAIGECCPDVLRPSGKMAGSAFNGPRAEVESGRIAS